MALGCSASWSTNRETVMLLDIHIHIALVEPELAPIVKLFVERFFMVRNLHLGEFMEEAVITMA